MKNKKGRLKKRPFLLVIFFGGSYTFYTFGMRIAL